MGHEFSGHIVEIGSGVKDFKVGDKVVRPPLPSRTMTTFSSVRTSLKLSLSRSPPSPFRAGSASIASEAGLAVVRASCAAIPRRLFSYLRPRISGVESLLFGSAKLAGAQAEYVRVPLAGAHWSVSRRLYALLMGVRRHDSVLGACRHQRPQPCVDG